MKTALLIGLTDEPIAMQLDPREFDRSKSYITWGVAGQMPRSYRFVREEGSLMLFRLVGAEISDEHFESVVAAEREKVEHPERFFDRVLYPEMYRRPVAVVRNGAHAMGF